MADLLAGVPLVFEEYTMPARPLAIAESVMEAPSGVPFCLMASAVPCTSA